VKTLCCLLGLLLVGVALCLSALRAGPDDPAEGSPATTISFRGHSYLVRTVNPKTEDLRLYWKDSAGRPLHTFRALEAQVRSDGQRLLFAANAGMFQPDYSPVGLLVMNGEQIAPLNLQEGTGNFYLKPNGVFVVTDEHKAEVMESSSYATFLPRVLWATQSGPLLVHHGDIHPDLIEGSPNLMVRSGVGVRKDGTAVFVLSKGTVDFYEFALFFAEPMKCPNALYLDGHISAFHLPGDAEKPDAPMFGPMFGVVAP
jgi:uncharacterized protein YigE (DUF2233 family)